MHRGECVLAVARRELQLSGTAALCPLSRRLEHDSPVAVFEAQLPKGDPLRLVFRWRRREVDRGEGRGEGREERDEEKRFTHGRTSGAWLIDLVPALLLKVGGELQGARRRARRQGGIVK